MTRSFVLPAFAKINLGLTVLDRRADGYHELRTVFQSISLHDDLVFETPVARFGFTCDDPSVPSGRENLVVRAARAFARAARRRLRLRIALHKRIPAARGLGGGSSDAAATLAGLNRIHGRPLAPDALLRIAAGLGSDVPFFLLGGTALGLGRGEILRPLRDLQSVSVLILVPKFGISTADAYRRVGRVLTPHRGQISIYRFSTQGVRQSGAARFAPNDLEQAVAPIHPGLAGFLSQIRAHGAAHAAMTGSGSAVFGLFAGERRARSAYDDLKRSVGPGYVWLGRTVGAARYARALGMLPFVENG